MTAVRFSNWLSPKGIDLDRQTGDRLSDEANVLPGAFVQHDSVPATLRQVFTKRSDLLAQPVTKRSDLLVQPVTKRDNLGAQRRIQAVDAFTDPSSAETVSTSMRRPILASSNVHKAWRCASCARPLDGHCSRKKKGGDPSDHRPPPSLA
jgi:hypothetical protein